MSLLFVLVFPKAGCSLMFSTEPLGPEAEQLFLHKYQIIPLSIGVIWLNHM